MELPGDFLVICISCEKSKHVYGLMLKDLTKMKNRDFFNFSILLWLRQTDMLCYRQRMKKGVKWGPFLKLKWYTYTTKKNLKRTYYDLRHYHGNDSSTNPVAGKWPQREEDGTTNCTREEIIKCLGSFKSPWRRPGCKSIKCHTFR